MIEFDMNNSFDNMNPDNKPVDESKNTENTENADETVKTENNTENAAHVQNTPEDQTSTAAGENPCFQGDGSQPDYRVQQHQREYPYQTTGTQQNNAPYTGYRPQTYNGYNAYAPRNQQYDHSQYQNQQAHSQQYGQGQISYTPAPERKKRKKGTSAGLIAVICAGAVILSGITGFGGALLANRLSENNNPEIPAAQTGETPSSGEAVVEQPVVIYRNMEEVATATSTDGENLTYSQVAAIVKDSVVEIVTEFTVQSGWYQYVTQGAGSGVIISEDGYIITNTHVIADESTGVPSSQITVRLSNGTEYPAKTIGYDTDSDISIIKIEETGLTAAQCGNSDNLAVGEELVIVGNPLGELGGTVTNGIVSATEREILVNNVTMSLIQTNAAVNPGNSGGGMFNMKGQLVGIVNAKSSGSNIEGLGFAIPVNEALDITKQLLEYGYVRGKTMIGVSFEQVSGSNYLFYYNIEPGLYVTSVSKGYNDEVLEVGDRVVAVNGETVSAVSDIKSIVTESSVGDKIKFQIERDRKLMEVEVTCFERVPTPVTEEENIEFDKESAETTPAWNSQIPSDIFDIFPDFFGY